ncbi:unnamed protein product [Arabis nemorensis]|uniref:F-box/LRR-repeat protein 15/At3g58940/PEG3-like LRR domain-containing protein n=1 Tax=Arabis nemorensis TaxID=586526 RepID=A0A565BXQ8_9BRAS|nr:unnamed protein product [Arabis nemorensis]
MVLSKMWRNLFTIIPKLHFDGDDEGSSSFEDFVDGVLALPRGVSVLVLEIKVADQGGYSLPLEVFTCKTVARMKLGSGFAIDFLPADAFLPALKTLVLDTVMFCGFDGRCAFKTLLSASHVLEELVIDGSSGNVGNGLALCPVQPSKDLLSDVMSGILYQF